ncbi:MAG: T9SS type A sorting domain-containing protein [Flavobacteriales bacterium]|nr:T9SS type A sorting domain-containing protein [Flavobacteriales bacterium]
MYNGKIHKIKDKLNTGIGEKNVVTTCSVSPNPFSEFATITFGNKNNSLHSLQIYSILGVKVNEFNNIGGNKIQIDGAQLGKGIYFYSLSNEANLLLSGKLIVN